MKLGPKCKAEIKDNILFESIEENQILRLSCRKNATGEVIRKCNNGTEPEWGEYESTCGNIYD